MRSTTKVYLVIFGIPALAIACYLAWKVGSPRGRAVNEASKALEACEVMVRRGSALSEDCTALRAQYRAELGVNP